MFISGKSVVFTNVLLILYLELLSKICGYLVNTYKVKMESKLQHNSYMNLVNFTLTDVEYFKCKLDVIGQTRNCIMHL